MQKGKMVIGGGLANSYEKKRSERKWRKEKINAFMPTAQNLNPFQQY